MSTPESNAIAFDQYQTYWVRIQLRRSPEYCVKPTCELLNGRRLRLEVLWRITPEDSSLYAGEWALGPRREDLKTRHAFELARITWIASGDVVLLGEGS